MNPLYPFSGHFFPRPSGRIHYLDEGSGPTVVMLHGNPTWSFYYRSLVLALRDRYRCVAPDHLGCGLSDKPPFPTYDYALKSRIDDLEALLDHLGLTGNLTLIVHDWGGMIGLGYAARHPGRVTQLIASNTAAFHLPPGKSFPLLLRLGRDTRLGAWSILRRNAFCRAAARWNVTRRPLDPAVRDMYLMPYDTPEHRIAVLKFVQTIPLKPTDPGYDIVTQTAAAMAAMASIPTLLLWGLRDFVFDEHFLREWQRLLPRAETRVWPDCGHYLLDDAGDEVVGVVREFLGRGSEYSR